MKFFQRLNICKKCSLAFKPTYQSDELCPTHYQEKAEKDFEDAKFQAWVKRNRIRLETEMKVEEKKDAAEREESSNKAMNQALSGLYGSALQQSQYSNAYQTKGYT